MITITITDKELCHLIVALGTEIKHQKIPERAVELKALKKQLLASISMNQGEI